LGSPEEDKKRDLIRSALDVIAAQRGKTDLSLVRRVIDETGTSPTHNVITYLKVLGSHEDVMRLALTSQFSWSGFDDRFVEVNFNAAADAILKLAGRPFSVLGSSWNLPQILR
jgi:hypothetical protein